MGRITTSASVCRHRLQWSSDSVLSAARGRISRKHERSLTLIGRVDALLDNDRRRDAKVHCHRMSRKLDQELDMAPSPEARRLFAQICGN